MENSLLRGPFPIPFPLPILSSPFPPHFPFPSFSFPNNPPLPPNHNMVSATTTATPENTPTKLSSFRLGSNAELDLDYISFCYNQDQLDDLMGLLRQCLAMRPSERRKCLRGVLKRLLTVMESTIALQQRHVAAAEMHAAESRIRVIALRHVLVRPFGSSSSSSSSSPPTSIPSPPPVIGANCDHILITDR